MFLNVKSSFINNYFFLSNIPITNFSTFTVIYVCI